MPPSTFPTFQDFPTFSYLSNLCRIGSSHVSRASIQGQNGADTEVMPAEAGQREQDSPNGSRGDATKDLDLELLERVGKKPRGLKVRTLPWNMARIDLILAI